MLVPFRHLVNAVHTFITSIHRWNVNNSDDSAVGRLLALTVAWEAASEGACSGASDVRGARGVLFWRLRDTRQSTGAP